MAQVTTKKCGPCGDDKPLDGFHRDKRSVDGRCSACKACKRAATREWYAANKERARTNERKYRATPQGREARRQAQTKYSKTERGRAAARAKAKRYAERYPEKVRATSRRTRIRSSYGLSEAEYDAIIVRGCTICGADASRDIIHLDHDHVTGRIRDALCSNCNHGLGHFRDNPDLLLVAVEYLRTHSACE